MAKVTNKLDASWLDERLDVIKTHLKKAKKDRPSQPQNLIAALAVVLKIIRLAKMEERKKLRGALKRAVLKHYQEKKLRKPRKECNPLVPIVKLCIPGDGPKYDKDRNRYTGYLTYCVLNRIQSNTLWTKFLEGTRGLRHSSSGPRANRNSINRLSRTGHQEWKEEKPSIGIKIDWSKLQRG
jgi:hypothetical protein